MAPGESAFVCIHLCLGKGAVFIYLSEFPPLDISPSRLHHPGIIKYPTLHPLFKNACDRLHYLTRPVSRSSTCALVLMTAGHKQHPERLESQLLDMAAKTTQTFSYRLSQVAHPCSECLWPKARCLRLSQYASGWLRRWVATLPVLCTNLATSELCYWHSVLYKTDANIILKQGVNYSSHCNTSFRHFSMRNLGAVGIHRLRGHRWWRLHDMSDCELSQVHHQDTCQKRRVGKLLHWLQPPRQSLRYTVRSVFRHAHTCFDVGRRWGKHCSDLWAWPNSISICRSMIGKGKYCRRDNTSGSRPSGGHGFPTRDGQTGLLHRRHERHLMTTTWRLLLCTFAIATTATAATIATTATSATAATAVNVHYGSMLLVTTTSIALMTICSISSIVALHLRCIHLKSVYL